MLKETIMNDKLFWELIDSGIKVGKKDIKKCIAEIEIQLSKYSIQHIKGFDNYIYVLIENAGFNGLYDTAKNIFKENLTTNNFEFFIGWIIMQGSKLYINSINDPGFLTEVIEVNFSNNLGSLFCESTIHIASSAYTLKTGGNFYEDY